MKLSALALLTSTLIVGYSSQILAEKYQSFTHAGYSKLDSDSDYKNYDRTSFGIGTRYFFDARSTLGPLNQFKYINTISNISAGYNYSEYSSFGGSNSTDYHSKGDANTVNVNGEWFSGDFLLGGGYSHTDSEHFLSFDKESRLNPYRFRANGSKSYNC